jgi:hypothetical protein
MNESDSLPGFPECLGYGSLPKWWVVCPAIEIRTAERGIGRAKESDNGNSRQELSEVCDQTLALQPRSTMPDDNNSHPRS